MAHDVYMFVSMTYMQVMGIISVRLKIIGSNAPRVPKITHCNVNVKYERICSPCTWL